MTDYFQACGIFSTISAVVLILWMVTSWIMAKWEDYLEHKDD